MAGLIWSNDELTEASRGSDLSHFLGEGHYACTHILQQLCLAPDSKYSASNCNEILEVTYWGNGLPTSKAKYSWNKKHFSGLKWLADLSTKLEREGKCNSKYFTVTFSEPKLMYSSFKNPRVVAFSSPTIQLRQILLLPPPFLHQFDSKPSTLTQPSRVRPPVMHSIPSSPSPPSSRNAKASACPLSEIMISPVALQYSTKALPVH